MGPYCKFCNNRCFVYMPQDTPKHILEAYGTSTIIASCPQGQEFERKKVGYCLDDIRQAIEGQEDGSYWEYIAKGTDPVWGAFTDLGE